MAIRRIATTDDEVKWVVDTYALGRGTKRIRKVFNKKSEAEVFVVELKKASYEARKGTGSKTFEETSFETEAKFWLSTRGTKFSQSHLVRVNGILKMLLPAYGRYQPNFFTAARLTAIQGELLGRKLKPASVNRMTEVIMAILNCSVKHRRIPFNPAIGFEKFNEYREEMKFWDAQEAASFLKYVNGRYQKDSPRRWVYVAYLLALNTAMRAGEIWGLQKGDIVESGEILFVRRQWNRVEGDFSIPKGKDPRRVPCQPILRDELLDICKHSPGKTVFHGVTGNPINHDAFAEIFERDVKRWGGKQIRFHDLRHTATTLLIAFGIDLKTVKEICGHKDISTTMKYAHLIENRINSVAKQFSVSPHVTDVIEISARSQLKLIK